jgi:hypothetical protein
LDERLQLTKLVQLEGEAGAYCDPLTGECFPANLQAKPQKTEKIIQQTGSGGKKISKKKPD